MKIFYCGDVVGRSGRNAVVENIEKIRETYRPDVFIANIENSAHGFGAVPSIAKDFLDKGVDFLVTGNHAYKQKDIIPFFNESKKIIRPINFPKGSPGKGFGEFETARGRKILIAQAMGNLPGYEMDNPIKVIDEMLEDYALGKNIDAIFVDFHAEFTAEKLAFGFHLDGRVSAVAGTHTHVPTADARILPNGTAYITDVGMCGDYDSVIGFGKEEPIARLAGEMTGGRLVISEGKGTLFGVFIETDDKIGLAVKIEQVKIF